MQLFTVILGIEKDGAGKALNPETTPALVRALKLEAAQRFGGYSCDAVNGGWVNKDNELIEELSLRIQVQAAHYAEVLVFARIAGRALGQSSVLIADGHQSALVSVEETVAKAA